MLKMAKLAWSPRRTSTTLLRLEVGFNRVQLMAAESEIAAAMVVLDDVGTVLQAT